MTEFMERVTDTESTGCIAFDYSAQQETFEKTFGVLQQTLEENTCKRWMKTRFGGGFSNHHFEAFTLGIAKVIASIDSSDNEQLIKVRETLDGIEKDPDFQALTTGGGKNSPGPYRDKINFVAGRVRSAL